MDADVADVIVVGAGLAGLRCAQALTDAGREVVVLEAADAVGGRIRTDGVDGYLVDRGFQLLNPAYPAVRRWVDVEALQLHAFGAGVAAVGEDGMVVLGHPLAAPRLLTPTLGVAARHVKEVAAVARWAAPLLAPRPRRTLSQVLARRPGLAELDRRTALDAACVDGLVRRVLDRFLAGVLLEDDGSTADTFTLLLLWMFARGVPSLPAHGMQALPEQLAGRLGDAVRLGHRAERVEPGRVSVDGRSWSARHVVVATDGPAAHALTGVEAPPTKGVVTTWWSTTEGALPPRRAPLLHVDARVEPTGPLVNTALVSHVAPGYAPPGHHLVQGSALLGPRPGHGRRPTEPEMRRHAGELLGLDPTGWQVVARHEVPDALPAQPAPYAARRPVEVGGLVVCGDHRDTGSIQGALVSGERAARAVLASSR